MAHRSCRSFPQFAADLLPRYAFRCQFPPEKKRRHTQRKEELAMPTYHGGNSGVTSYNVGENFILVRFESGIRYLYNECVTGRRHVQAMKKLAGRNEGLATYINQHVREKYATRLA